MCLTLPIFVDKQYFIETIKPEIQSNNKTKQKQQKLGGSAHKRPRIRTKKLKRIGNTILNEQRRELRSSHYERRTETPNKQTSKGRKKALASKHNASVRHGQHRGPKKATTTT